MAGDSLGQTRVAFIGTNFAQAFANEFFELEVSGFVPFIQPLEVQSTEGGKFARQPLVLRAPDGGATIAVGWVNVATKECSVKSYDNVVAAHRQRFPDRPLSLDRASYQQFLAAVQRFMTSRQMHFEVEQKALDMSERPAAPRRAATGSNTLWIVLGVIGVLMTIGLVLFLLRR